MKELSIQLKDGEVIVREPTAGERNAALIKAETPEGIKGMVFAIEFPVVVSNTDRATSSNSSPRRVAV